MPEPVSPVPQPGIEARFSTLCPRCDKGIAPRDRVVYQRGHYVHTTCAAGADDE